MAGSRPGCNVDRMTMDVTAARTIAVAEEPRTVFRNDRQQDDQTRRPIHQSFVVPGQEQLGLKLESTKGTSQNARNVQSAVFEAPLSINFCPSVNSRQSIDS